MVTNPTSHLDAITPFLAMEVFARAQELERQGRAIIHLEFGEGDFPAPRAALESIVRSTRDRPIRYTDTRGLISLRQAIADKYRRDYGIDVSPEQVLASNGTSPLLFLALRLLAPAGSEVVITDPCYACYDNLIRLACLTPVRVPIRLEDGFRIDVQELRRKLTPRTRVILLNSPMNPTGSLLDRATYREIAAIGIPVISDEIYIDLTYGQEPLSYLHLDANAVVLNGFSKYYGMTGWRLGYMILPTEWMDVAARLHQNLMISANQMVQEAAVEVLAKGASECRGHKDEFDRRRRFLLGRMKELGMDPGYEPKGAFYVFYRYSAKRPSLELSLELLETTGVALTPGIDFGPGGEGYLRFSYANSLENLDRALDLLAQVDF